MGTLIKPRGTAAAPSRAVAARGAPAQSRFQYRARTPEEVKDRAQRALGGRDSYFSDDVTYFTPRVGDNTVRILPPPPDADWRMFNSPRAQEPGPYHYGINLAVHYDIGADKSAYLCLAKTKGEACPLCEERDRANQAGEEELADALKPSYRVAVWVIDRAQESKGPMLWNLPAGLDKDISKLTIDAGTGELLPVDSPEDGYDLSVVREGQGLKTQYKGLQFSRKPSPLSDDPADADRWLAWIIAHPLDSCLQFFEHDYIAKVYEGQPPPKAGGEEAERASRTATRPAVAAKPAAPAATAKPGIKPRIVPRTAPAPAPEPEPAAAAAGAELPTWEDLEALDEDGLGALFEAFEIDVPAEGFTEIEQIRDYVAEALQIAKPEAETAAAAPAAAGWRAKLAALKDKSK